MTPAALLYAGLLLLLGSGSLLFLRRRDALFLMGWFWVCFLLRVLLIWLNESFRLFEAKQADDIVLFVYEGLDEGGSALQKFGVQMWLNWPAFALFGPVSPIHFVTNAFIGAYAGPITYAYFATLFSSTTARLGAISATVAPAVLNYGFVGLRDIVLYVLVLVAALSSLHLACRPRFRGLHVAVITICVALAFVERPYLVPVMALPGLMILGMWAWRSAQRGPSRARPLIVFSLLFIIPGAAALLFMGAYSGLAAILNLSGANPLEAIGIFAQNRFARDIDTEGGDSHILPAQVFLNLPIVLRFPLQIAGMILVPMPWLLTNLTRWLALFDSLFVIACITGAIKNARLKAWSRPLRRISAVMVLTYFVGIAAFGLAVINAGNAFRMRMPLLPYVLIPATIYLARRLEQRRHAPGGDAA